MLKELWYLLDSCKESHVSSLYSLVRVPSCGKKPLGNSSFGSISTEEIVKDGRVEWFYGCISIVVIIGHNFRAQIVMRLVNQCFNQSAIINAPLIKWDSVILQTEILGGNQHSFELFLLVSLSVFLDHYMHREVLNKFKSELLQSVWIGFQVSLEGWKKLISIIISLGKFFKCLNGVLNSINKLLCLSLEALTCLWFLGIFENSVASHAPFKVHFEIVK